MKKSRGTSSFLFTLTIIFQIIPPFIRKLNKTQSNVQHYADFNQNGVDLIEIWSSFPFAGITRGRFYGYDLSPLFSGTPNDRLWYKDTPTRTETKSEGQTFGNLMIFPGGGC